MLSGEENELLTRVGPGTPMGELLRYYWIPALLSEEIPSPDCAPVQVRLLGEKLVAFRDSKGKIGLLGEHCLHRGTSLFYGRNEDCGLRCIYHGWKYDVDGRIVDTPAEPPDSDFKAKIRHTAYPTKEVAGMVFAYLGPREKMPLLPEYEWTRLPDSQTYVTNPFRSATISRDWRETVTLLTFLTFTVISDRTSTGRISPLPCWPRKQTLELEWFLSERLDPIRTMFESPTLSCPQSVMYRPTPIWSTTGLP